MCGYCCGGTPVEKRGEAHRVCAEECYNAPGKRTPPRPERDVPAEALVHVVEIRLDDVDDWSVCSVNVYPDAGSDLAAAVCELANRVEADLDRQGDTDRKRYTTRTLGGSLREVRLDVVHGEGKSYFRHTIKRADNDWPLRATAVDGSDDEGDRA